MLAELDTRETFTEDELRLLLVGLLAWERLAQPKLPGLNEELQVFFEKRVKPVREKVSREHMRLAARNRALCYRSGSCD